MSYRIGLDLGSTAIKVVLAENRALRWCRKVPTAPGQEALAMGLVQACLDELGLSMSDIESIAATGYGKSNFCKIFRAVTGETFHHALNRRRIAAARDLLRGTALPIATVAAEVGIPEAKTFSRVFYEVEGVTPREYRSRA